MAISNINPTRMELTKLKNKLVVTKRGHKLLKDKQDEMIRQFMAIIELTKKVREQVESQLSKAIKAFELAKTKMDTFEVYEALQGPTVELVLHTKSKNVMNVDVPDISVKSSTSLTTHNIITTPYEFDESVSIMNEISHGLIRLAELDKTCEMLSKEIEKTRRRVNAIEYVMIPEQVDTIKSIRMKLADAEMSNTIRVMKSKDIVIKKLLESKKAHSK